MGVVMQALPLFGAACGPAHPSRAVKTAVISSCGKYRYQLARVWDITIPLAVFCGMNASKADAFRDDLTITKEMTFAVQLGAGGLVKVNRFGWRDTDPEALDNAIANGEDIMGPENLAFVDAAIASPLVGFVVAAWGSHPLVREGSATFARRLAKFRDVRCLGRTKDGCPRHPSRLAYATPFEVFCKHTPEGDAAR